MKWNRLLAVLLAALLLAGCSGANDEAYDLGSDSAVYYRTDADVKTETGAAMDTEYSQSLTGEASISDYSQFNAKLIRTVRLDAQTREYETLMASLEAKVTALGGYIENREAHNGSEYTGRSSRYCSMTVRVPADRLSEFVTHVNENANVISTNETVEDITLQYVDTESRIAALETEQARLLELLESAADLSAILEIESRLSDVNYELESYGSRLRGYDNLVNYATVYLDINEVRELTPVEEPTTWERIRDGFIDSVQGVCDLAVELFVWFVVNLPWLVILGAAAAVAALLSRRSRRKRAERRKRHQTPQTPADPEAQ